jgi:predicted lipoprotein with Yx(FWY)xxD motif
VTRSRPITLLASTAVGVANNSLGSIMVDSTGRTQYLFKGDSGTKRACTGACATAWPPLLAKGAPTAGPGLTAPKLGTITRQPTGSPAGTTGGY